MSRQRTIILLILTLMLFFEKGFSQSIRGRIIDESNDEIPFANIILQTKDSVYTIGTTSDVNGNFSIEPTTESKIMVVSYVGFEKKYINITERKDCIGDIILTSRTNNLTEVVVKGTRPYYKLNDGTVVTNVQHTQLSGLPNINELLSFIPGAIKSPHGNIEIFGQGRPIIYINNRQIQSDVELQSLSPRDIQKMELITSPDAKYNASGKAVLKIFTTKKTESWSLSTNMKDAINEENSFSYDIRLGLHQEKFNFFTYYKYANPNNKVTQPQVKELLVGDDIFTYSSRDIQGLQKTKTHNFQLSTDYSLSKEAVFGISIDGRFKKNDDNRNGILAIQRDLDAETVVEHGNAYNNNVNFTHINTFYTGQFGRVSIDVNGDYVHNKSDNNQLTQEVDKGIVSQTFSSGKSRLDMMAVRADIDIKVSSVSHLSGGTELVYNNGNGQSTISADGIANSDYNNKENRYSVYADWKSVFRHISMYLGIRYEKYKLLYTDNVNPGSSVSRNFHNIFPSLRFSYTGSRWNHTLSLSSYVTRPTFRQLSNSNYYTNEYMYQTGNPLLHPTNAYTMKWQSGVSGMTMMVSYTYQKDYISTTFRSSDNVIVSSYKNFDKIQYLRASASYQHTWGDWSPSLSLGILQQFFKSEYRGDVLNHNRATAYISFNQTLRLPYDFSLFSYAYYSTGGNQGTVELEPYHSIDFGITKKLLKDRLTLTLQAEDIFHGMKFKEKERINAVKFTQTEDYHLWNYSLNISYRLNGKTQKYKGSNTLDSDINRL